MKTNKALVTATLLFLITVSSFSQDLELELNLRPALTSLRGNEIILDNYDPKISMSGGATLNFLVENNTVFNVGLLYERKGGKKEHDVVMKNDMNEIIGEGTITLQSNFDYLTIPIQWGKRIGKKVQFQFGVGIYTGILLKQEMGGTDLDGTEQYTDHREDFKTFDFGLSGSFCSYIPLNDKLFVKIGVDDFLGLTNVSDVRVANDGSIKHNSLGLSAGITVKLK